MIGIFDSGLGGLSILKSIQEKLPDESYIYLGDNARAPYGNKSEQAIYDFTAQGIKHLFDQGCQLVIIACNTISAVALRKIQQELIANEYPDRRVLGILVPTIEGITGADWEHANPITTPINEDSFAIGILATPQTTKSGAYTREIHKRNQSIQVVEQSCPNLAQHIEDGDENSYQQEITTCINNLEKKISNTYHAVLLGCTHYSLIIDQVREQLPDSVKIFDQASLVAHSLADYLDRHPEFKSTKNNPTTYLTTGNPDQISQQASELMKYNYSFQSVNI